MIIFNARRRNLDSVKTSYDVTHLPIMSWGPFTVGSSKLVLAFWSKLLFCS